MTKDATGAGLIVVVMGVSGCGKSTIASQLAARLGASCKDADELHSAANVARMSAGVPLTDEDRQPWLESVAAYAAASAAAADVSVIACSALKKRYRDTINRAGNVLYVHLSGSQQLILTRMNQRQGHFMPDQLLASQFAALQTPDPAVEQVVTVQVDAAVHEIVLSAEAQVRQFLNAQQSGLSH